MKKILVSILIGVMLISSLSVSASAGFSDVKETDWYYETVSAMTEKGLFKGKGDNLFCPNDTMTRAEFITVVSRMLYPDFRFAIIEGAYANEWWIEPYFALIHNGVIDLDLFVMDLETNISREEMAYVAASALVAKGEDFSNLDLSVKIPDINFVSEDYRLSVTMAYDAGVIVGDENGNFNPQKTLTRAEGATVLYRLVNESKRVKITEDTGGETTTPVNAAITIYEGQVRYNRNAQEGDLFIKKDGTQIVLKKGPNGILGEGQGVAPDVGLLGQVTEKGCDGFRYKVADYGSWSDSTGMRLQGNDYLINRTTGEGYWANELQILEAKYPAPDRDENPGSYEGQVSTDPYSLWMWKHNDWIPNVR